MNTVLYRVARFVVQFFLYLQIVPGTLTTGALMADGHLLAAIAVAAASAVSIALGVGVTRSAKWVAPLARVWMPLALSGIGASQFVSTDSWVAATGAIVLAGAIFVTVGRHLLGVAMKKENQ